jgi:hypothetical protein
MSSSRYLDTLGVDQSMLGNQAYASACVKTILAAHTSDHADFEDFSGVQVAARAALPETHVVRIAVEAPDADVNWASHVNILEQFPDMDPGAVAEEIKHATKFSARVGMDSAKVYPVAIAERITFHDEAKTGTYASAIKHALSAM